MPVKNAETTRGHPLLATVFDALFRLLRWWGGELFSLLPARLKHDGDAYTIEILSGLCASNVSFELLHGVNGAAWREGPFAGIPPFASKLFALGPRPMLRLPHDWLLEQTIWLPLAAERDLRQVLQFEFDSLTPFSPDSVHWTWKLVTRDAKGKRIAVRLSLVPRAMTDATLLALAAAGVVPRALQVPGSVDLDGGRPFRIFDLNDALPSGRSNKLIWKAAMAFAVASGVLATAIPFIRLYQDEHQTEAAIARLRPEILEEERLRTAIASAAAAVDAARLARERTVELIGVLKKLSAVLPDDTHLTELLVGGRTLTVSGESAEAPRLLSLLAADPGFVNPMFTSPIARNGAGTTDEFTLRVEIGS